MPTGSVGHIDQFFCLLTVPLLVAPWNVCHAEVFQSLLGRAYGRLDQAMHDHCELVVWIFAAEVVAAVAASGQVAHSREAGLAELAGGVLFQLVEDDALHRAGSYSGDSRIAP
jgi:hypothetical protein